MPTRDHAATIPSNIDPDCIYTTGEAARICRLSQQTIIRCFDAGRLQGFRVPGSRFRRIPGTELLRFIEANSIPSDKSGRAAPPPSRPERGPILLVSTDDRTVGDVRRSMSRSNGPAGQLLAARCPFEAGLWVGQLEPSVILLDVDMPGLDTAGVLRRLRSLPGRSGAHRVLLLGAGLRGDSAAALLSLGASSFHRKPIDGAALRQALDGPDH